MKQFMDKDFLLETETAKKLFHEYAKDMPIIDYHCHILPKEIAEDRRFENITQVWLGGDHYKWRFMRSCGIDEKYITGDASDYEKFVTWAKCLGRAIGNPLFHWSHLELKEYFGYNGVLCEKTADEVWNLCNAKLAEASMSTRNIIKQSNVAVICTTDDPIDDLHYHKAIAEDKSFDVKVLPTWRPDKAMNFEKPEFIDYIVKLAEVAGTGKISTFEHLTIALAKRMDFFESMGCVISDHALDYVYYNPASDEEVEEIFLKRMNRIPLKRSEIEKYKTAFMLFMGKEYSKKGWTMQLHYGCKRDNNANMYQKMGPDTGFDCINNYAPSEKLADFLNALDITGELPKTILYSLNPNDNQSIGTVLGCFQDSTAVSKIQQGSAWWFNDHKTGIVDQLTSLANLGNISGFVGMITDSRSFLSYTRHEYFRRIFCNFIGNLVENGEYPEDYDLLGEIAKDVSFNNANRYFAFDV